MTKELASISRQSSNSYSLNIDSSDKREIDGKNEKNVNKKNIKPDNSNMPRSEVAIDPNVCRRPEHSNINGKVNILKPGEVPKNGEVSLRSDSTKKTAKETNELADVNGQEEGRSDEVKEGEGAEQSNSKEMTACQKTLAWGALLAGLGGYIALWVVQPVIALFVTLFAAAVIVGGFLWANG